jgi:hypothetical protein
MLSIHSDDDGYVYATDAYTVIRVPFYDCGLIYKPVQGFPNAKRMYEDVLITEEFCINTQSLINVLAEFKWTRFIETKKCEKCKGEGEQYCDCCQNTNECKACHGEGEKYIGTKECSLLTTTDGGMFVAFLKHAFAPRYIHQVAICAKVLGVDKIACKIINHSKSARFDVGSAQIIIPITVESGFEILKNVKTTK